MNVAILNTDPLTCNYGGVAPFMKNLDPFLQKAFNIKYYYVPEKKKKGLIPRRFQIMWLLWRKRNELSRFDFIISHIPEGSYIASYCNVPYTHIYHGNDNPMSVSRYWYGKYFAKVYDCFYKRIVQTATLKYTVGPTWGNVKKIFNPILHNVKPTPIESRVGFIFAGRLEAGKHIDRLIRIYAKIPAEIQDIHHFYIAGYGSQEQTLKELVGQLNLEDKIHFTGSLSNKELITEDSKRKILLMASEKEGLPNVIAEAFSVGVPVVSTAAGDIARVLKNGYNGYILPLTFTDEEYIDAIKKTLDDYERLSSNALETATVFRAENVAAGLINDINNILQNLHFSNEFP